MLSNILVSHSHSVFNHGGKKHTFLTQSVGRRARLRGTRANCMKCRRRMTSGVTQWQRSDRPARAAPPYMTTRRRNTGRVVTRWPADPTQPRGGRDRVSYRPPKSSVRPTERPHREAPSSGRTRVNRRSDRQRPNAARSTAFVIQERNNGRIRPPSIKNIYTSLFTQIAASKTGARFTKYLTIHRKIIVSLS